MSGFHGQGHRLGGPATTTSTTSSSSRYGGAPPPVQPAYATTPADLSNIPVAEVVGTAGGGQQAPPQQAAVPNAQMAYTVRTQQQMPMQQEPPVMVVDPALARYLASQEQGVLPPPPPDHMPLSILSCCCCWPVALMAIYHSRLVSFFYQRGQYLQAYEASRRAKQLALMGIVLGTITMVIYFMAVRRQRMPAKVDG